MPEHNQLIYPISPNPVPQDFGFKAWNYEPNAAAGTTIVPTAGLLHLLRVDIDRSTLITNIHMQVTTSGGTLTSSQNFIGLYKGITLVGTSADMKATWEAAAGLKTMALATPYTAEPGTYFVGLFYNGTTAPTFARSTTGITIVNGLLSAEDARHASANGSLTTALPTTTTARTATTNSWWVALS